MKGTISLVLMILAGLLFLAEAFHVTTRISLGWLGMFCLAASFVF
jgi:hypothetical protein